eukprot:g23355.t1
MLLQFVGGIIETLEEALDWHITQGVGGGVEIVCNEKVLFVLYKAVSEPLLGLTNVEEATLGTADAIDHIDNVLVNLCLMWK